MGAPLLAILDLAIHFATPQGALEAVSHLSFQIEKGKIAALVGESGCGKSVSALSILRLLDTPPARLSSGKILFNGQDLLALPEKALREVRGNRIAMIFQEPMTALNPVFTVGNQIAEVLTTHKGLSKTAALSESEALLREVGIPDAKRRLSSYPHELSGGMRQRVMIAMAIACRPELLIADEPTTALDVTVQAQILDLLKRLQEEHGMAILLITHDLGIVAQVADTVSVMYAGEIVESGSVHAIFEHPLHPYTAALMRALPKLGSTAPLESIPGRVPRRFGPLESCAFADRCKAVQADCRAQHPALVDRAPAHSARCFHPL